MNINNSLVINRVAIAGGVLGLVPFWGLALAPWWMAGDALGAAQGYLLHYAALIVTFVGAIRWGLALALSPAVLSARRRSVLFGWSLSPCVLAWFLLMLSPTTALLGMASLLLLQLLLDFAVLWRAQLIAPWFWRLRLLLSAGAVPALLWSALG